jgi:hypothetical protein
MAKKKFDPKAKAKRQKIFAGVGGLLLVVLLGIQVPRTMKLMNSSGQTTGSSTPSSTTTAAGTQALAPPSLAGGSVAGGSATGGSTSAAATSADGILDPASPLPPDAGQLVSFSDFKSKDPFKQQVSTECASDSTSPVPASCASASTPVPTASASSSPDAGAAPASLTSGARAPVSSAKATTATISVNGNSSSVSVGASFPAPQPVFTLVSLSRTAAKIGIAGGSYESGATTVTLKMGKTVTLQNTSDGARYSLRLIATV